MADLRESAKMPTFELVSCPKTGLSFCIICRIIVIDLHAHNMKHEDPAHVAASVLEA